MAGIVRAFPLTPLQEGMLYHGLRSPGSSLYHGQLRADLEGPLDVEAFRAAWAGAIRRHEALRTFFAWERRERPLQVVRDEVELPLRVLDWRGVETAEAERRWAALVEDDSNRPLDLTQAPLMRVYLVRFTDERHRLLWGVHHAVADGWSAELVVDEILEELEAARGGTKPAIQPAPSYAEFVGWLESRDREAARAWWTARLAGLPGPTPLPTPARSGEDASRVSDERVLDEAETRTLKDVAGGLRVTLATLTAAAWAIVLARHTRTRDVVFGVTNSERPAEIRGVDRAVGLYLNTLPARVRLDDAEAMAAWLERLQLELSEARQHGSPGLSDLKRWADVQGADLFTSLIAFENYPDSLGGAASSGALRMTSVAVDVPTELPLALLVYPGRTLTLELVRDPVRVTSAEARALLAEVADVMRAFEEARQVGDLTRATTDPVPEGWTRGTELPSPPADVVDRILEHVRDRADTPALRGPQGSVGWGEFGRWTAGLAQRLAEATPPGAVVGILADRSPAAVAAMVATLRACRTYVPLDAHAPAGRLAVLLEGVDAVWVRRGAEDRLPSSHPLVLSLADLPDSQAVESGAEMPTPAAGIDAPRPEAPAYVVYTSGSTGTPKGVVVTRANLAWSTAARFAHYDSPPEVFLLLSPMHVDSSVAGIYWTLAAGGTLVLPPYRAEQDAASLGRLVDEAGVTHTLLVPSLHGALLDSVAPDRLASLRSVIVAGEACPEEVVRRHGTVLPGVTLHNEYGPSEATVWATVDDLTAEPAGPVTIGRPVPGARVAVVDESLRPVPVGVTGELVIAGPGVATGYRGRQDLTDERFVAVEGLGRAYRTGDRARWRADGRLEFLGRADDQFKIRGHRVEAGEIEEALRRHPAVDEAVVGLIHGGGQPALAAWLTMAGARVAPEALKTFLAGTLPAHMVPAHYAILDSMPRTPAGKLDRRAVQARGPGPTAPRATSGSASRTRPESATERTLAAVWSDVLGLEEVG
ncbi:MAG: amino acid adenylation domain-containing protein, partial [Gemmatimonadetes bacterium]|nr:amino acid adenylation domain-containing protein [Gemmatimonadota bacterium]